MTNDLSTSTRRVRNLAGAALAAVIVLMTLTVVAPATAHAAGETASVNPSTAAAGEAVTIAGSGFQPGEGVEVRYGGSTIASGVADGNGDFSVSGAIPGGIPEGGHPMDVVGSMGSTVSLSCDIVAPASPPPAPPTPAPPKPAMPRPAPPTPAPSTASAPTPPTPKASVPAGPDTTAEDAMADSSSDGDGLTELALGETAGTNHEVGANARIWGLVLVVVAAAGLVLCALAVHRSQREGA